MRVQSSATKRVEVRAPMSGIFYRQPGPDQSPYVEVGDRVEKKQVLALLETMKAFQKIKSPVSGKILEIVQANEAPVKDDDVLFVIDAQA
jgi:acetyl-CoA carboxylase biotin carboxyl carrier protein